MKQKLSLASFLWGLHDLLFYILGAIIITVHTFEKNSASVIFPPLLHSALLIIIFGYALTGIEIGRKKRNERTIQGAFLTLILYLVNFGIITFLSNDSFLKKFYLNASIQFTGIMVFVLFIICIAITRRLTRRVDTEKMEKLKKRWKKMNYTLGNTIMVGLFSLFLVGSLILATYTVGKQSYHGFLQQSTIGDTSLLTGYFLLQLLSVIWPHLKTIKKPS